MSTAFQYLAERAGSREPIDTIRLAFEHHLFVIIPEFFVRVREYEAGLELAEYCTAVLEAGKDTLEWHRYVSWTQHLLLFKLDMLDRLNEWDEYLKLCAGFLESNEAKYIEHYPNQEPVGEKERFIKLREKGKVYLCFVHKIEWRRKIIQRKYDRAKMGKPVEHIKRHQRDRLTDEEIIRRADAFFQWHNIRFTKE